LVAGSQVVGTATATEGTAIATEGRAVVVDMLAAVGMAATEGTAIATEARAADNLVIDKVAVVVRVIHKAAIAEWVTAVNKAVGNLVVPSATDIESAENIQAAVRLKLGRRAASILVGAGHKLKPQAVGIQVKVESALARRAVRNLAVSMAIRSQVGQL
jgi:hypothetical protein